MAMTGTAATDSFVAEYLPPPAQWPVRNFDLPELAYPARLNCVPVLLDRWATDRLCLISPAKTWSYGELRDRVDRIARVLAGELGLVPGGRVLLRAANTPMLVACTLAVMKAGGVGVATMPLLRARELAYPNKKARNALALCDARRLWLGCRDDPRLAGVRQGDDRPL
jgi:2-aminobenzoate-CoA ligase